MMTPDYSNQDRGSDSDSGQSDSTPRGRPRQRDTVILYSADFYDHMGIKNIPLPEFRELSQIIGDNFGINVGENKITLVTGRIHPIMEKHGFSSHREYINAIKADKTGELLSELANRVSTNHTAFYREEAHFSLMLDTILPDLIKRKNEENSKDIRIWSAACATGEEPYTILFTLIKYLHFDYANWHAGVLATDISAAALDTAKRGLYNKQRLTAVPPDVLKLYFHQVDDENYEVKPEYRAEVTFRRLNLISDVYPFRQRFDIVFCRNVMIYFSRATRSKLLDKMREWLLPGGYLFVGHSESLIGSHRGYENVAPAVYRRVE
ncbi:MAG: methyltransferase domain-containing protein [Planctomycetes bacterium]|nr:methyltransferase domain-containing protein [Planctomycetota bacterium]